METKTKLSTCDVIAAMLTENTGTHMLDSGGYYGRNWERNTGLTVADFEAQPTAELDEYGTVSVNVYHFLKNCLEFDAELNENFQQFRNELPDEYDLEIISQWIEYVDASLGAWMGGQFNTYNWENSLSQVLQGSIFRFNSCDYVALQIHGGADVRGGYTAPVIFKVDVEQFFSGMDNFELSCAGDPDFVDGQLNLNGEPATQTVHYWNYSGEWFDSEGGYLGANGIDLWDMATQARSQGLDYIPCPVCNTKLSVTA